MDFQSRQEKAFMREEEMGKKHTGLVFEAEICLKTELPHVILSVAF